MTFYYSIWDVCKSDISGNVALHGLNIHLNAEKWFPDYSTDDR